MDGAALPARRFHDAHHAFEYLVGKAIGERILADPSLLAAARDSPARETADEPRHAHVKAIWERLLALPAEDVAAQLARNDAEGDLIRQTRPPFVALDARLRADLVAEARRLVAGG